MFTRLEYKFEWLLWWEQLSLSVKVKGADCQMLWLRNISGKVHLEGDWPPFLFSLLLSPAIKPWPLISSKFALTALYISQLTLVLWTGGPDIISNQHHLHSNLPSTVSTHSCVGMHWTNTKCSRTQQTQTLFQPSRGPETRTCSMVATRHLGAGHLQCSQSPLRRAVCDINTGFPGLVQKEYHIYH